MTFRALAILALVAAGALPFVGQQRLLKLINWGTTVPVIVRRLMFLLAGTFAVFMIWSTIVVFCLKVHCQQSVMMAVE